MTGFWPLPTYEQVRALPQLLSTVVSDEHEDANGHLSVTGYMALKEQAAWAWLGGLGLDPSTSGRPLGIMELEQHLRYVGELHVGDTVAIHARLLERAERRVHGVWFLVDEVAQRLACTFEFVSVHVNLDQRRATTFDGPTAMALDAEIRESSHEWPAPVSGAMGLRPPA